MDATIIAEGMNAPQALDFSLWALFLKADVVVKSVMSMLLVASVWSWAIIIDKWLSIGRVQRKADKFENAFWSGRPLDELYRSLGQKGDHPFAVVFRAAMREWKRSIEAAGDFTPSVQERVERVMNTAINKELARLERYMNFLATVGSVSPFIGLFGTVWGIMNSFQSIAISRDTNLAVVAPGIAEALFATALGLAAAIPAVMAYNKFSSDINRYATRLEGFASDFSAILSRQLDEGAF